MAIDEGSNGHGLTLHRSKPADAPFITWAGLWAEARLTWPLLTLDGLDHEDGKGYTFADYITGVWLGQPDDAEVLGRYEAESLMPELLPATYSTWHMLMEREWPNVRALAEGLLK
ncbi:hypothetical protein N864_22595 [Intrasporangium chromatireducens Q5-1]|uniref:Uncharacterized protein n=1 Tax=Intrasporangium chromatireducens Q5-1 TaxID=584657 RepID=W9GJA0_9MICO|nr:hypothetical protein [Intrasporangium chromatireducens]EWT06321.1 hypothetical protein N864_22595 [Intrasporangium chromatireducens Q5-1]